MTRGTQYAAAVLLALSAAAAPQDTKPKFDLLAKIKRYPHPWGGLAQGLDGQLYSTTSGEGRVPGQVFKINTSGQLTTVHKLAGRSEAGLLLATDGNLYGTTQVGGKRKAGAVFRVGGDGKPRNMYEFCLQSGCPDGELPQSSLIQGSDGNLYGTTFSGGAGSNGTIFRMTLTGEISTIYSFCSQPKCTDGGAPTAPPVQASDGNYYGTTTGGGISTYGIIYRLTASGDLTVLHSFCSEPDCPDGGQPYAGLVQASDGNLYGTTAGPSVVYRLGLEGSYQVIYSFCSKPKCADGSGPAAPLVQATDGNLYGTTVGGGTKYGTVFRITLDGKLATLHDFCSQPNCRDGVGPFGPLLQATDGNLYGTTYGIEHSYHGTVFRLSTGFAPFVSALPAYGSAGGNITILGYNLTGASAVTFNGTPSSFTVNSTGTAITATVPAGATTGSIQVTLADGSTLSSNVPFHVTQ